MSRGSFMVERSSWLAMRALYGAATAPRNLNLLN